MEDRLYAAAAPLVEVNSLDSSCVDLAISEPQESAVIAAGEALNQTKIDADIKISKPSSVSFSSGSDSDGSFISCQVSHRSKRVVPSASEQILGAVKVAPLGQKGGSPNESVDTVT